MIEIARINGNFDIYTTRYSVSTFNWYNNINNQGKIFIEWKRMDWELRWMLWRFRNIWIATTPLLNNHKFQINSKWNIIALKLLSLLRTSICKKRRLLLIEKAETNGGLTAVWYDSGIIKMTLKFKIYYYQHQFLLYFYLFMHVWICYRVKFGFDMGHNWELSGAPE